MGINGTERVLFTVVFCLLGDLCVCVLGWDGAILDLRRAELAVGMNQPNQIDQLKCTRCLRDGLES